MNKEKTILWENVKSRAIYIQQNRATPNEVTGVYSSFFQQKSGLDVAGWELAIALTEEIDRLWNRILLLESDSTKI